MARSMRFEPTTATDNGEFAEDHDILWRQFASAGSLEAFCAKWLTLQCRIIPDVAAGVVLIAPEENRPFTPAAFWPDKTHDVKHLAEVAERAVVERRGLVLKRSAPAGDSSRSRYDIAYPIQAGGRT